MKPKSLKLDLIVTTAGTQIRASINAEAVDQYAEAMQEASNVFPPVVVFHDGNEYILADGFHRVMAASRNGFKDILADIRKGSKADALKYALSANATHGIPRTNRDKRRCVELALAEWPKLSDAEVSRICAVSQPFVGSVRKETQPITVIGSEKRTGADGKERKLPTRKQSPTRTQEPEPEPQPQPNTVDAEWLQALGKPQKPAEPNDSLEVAIADLKYVITEALPKLAPEDRKKYKAALLELAETI